MTAARSAREVRRRGGRPFIQRQVNRRSRPEVNANKRAWNAAIAQVRARIEKVFGTAKRSYGLARARYRGLARVTCQVRLTFLAYNLRRTVTLLQTAPA